jgi:hypothetical protein
MLFKEPQPTNTSNLSKFPRRIQGTYISLENNTTLRITSNLIQRIFNADFKIHPNEIDSTMRLSGDTLIDLNANEKYLIKKVGDSLAGQFHYDDTLFILNKVNVLKKFRGYYFLNTYYDKQCWGVMKVKYSKGQLTIGNISSELDIKNLVEITETPQDTIYPYRFTPTKKQFKKFLKIDGFSDKEIFERIKEH